MSARELPGTLVRVQPDRLPPEILDDVAREIARGTRLFKRRLPLSAHVIKSLIETNAYDEKVVGGWTCSAAQLSRGPWRALHVLDVARIHATLRCRSGIEFTNPRWAAGFASDALRRLCRGTRASGNWRAHVGLAADVLHAIAQQQRPSPLRGERALGERLIGDCDHEDATVRSVAEVARVALAGCKRLDGTYVCERDTARLLSIWEVVSPVIRAVTHASRPYAECYGRWLYRDAVHAGRSAVARREFGRAAAELMLEREERGAR